MKKCLLAAWYAVKNIVAIGWYAEQIRRYEWKIIRAKDSDDRSRYHNKVRKYQKELNIYVFFIDEIFHDIRRTYWKGV